MSLQAPALDYLVRSFHPGYMGGPQPDLLPKGATPDAKNCLFASLQLEPTRATLAKRTGARQLIASAVVNGRGFDGLCEFRRVGDPTGILVAVINGSVWRWTGTAFVPIGLTAPFLVGTPVQFAVQRNLLTISDGTVSRLWDGDPLTDLFADGEDAPTGAPTLTVSAGPGPTGTFEGFGAWYDRTHDHETSPGPLTAQVAFANQARTWAKPAGAAAANYQHWRVYCRRVDTNEVYFKRVAEVSVGLLTVTETLSDAARNLATLGPTPGQNDKPPVSLLVRTEFQGYRIAVKQGDDQLYVSKLNDPQSQHPSDILGVARGVGGDIRSVSKFAKQCVVQKAAKTYRLDGDRMPFIPWEVHGSFGNVGRRSTAEVKGLFYAWDEDKGPYETDLAGRWEPIATGRVQTIVSRVPKTAATDIECVFVKTLNLVIWSVPQGSATRRRTLLAWHTELRSWLPPMTGLEYACLTTLVDSTGATNLYVGDYWGRLFQYFTDNVEGVPSGTLIARVASSTPSTVTCNNEVAIGLTGTQTIGGAAAFYTTGDGLMGLPVLHLDQRGNSQWRRIRMNTAGTLTLDVTNDSPWNVLPVPGDLIVVGGIDWFWTSPVVDYGDPFVKKIGRLFMLQATPASSTFRLALQVFKEGLSVRDYRRTFALSGTGGWGSGLWGAMLWGGADPSRQKMRLGRTFFGLAVRVENPFPNQPVELIALRVTADVLGQRLVSSGGEAA